VKEPNTVANNVESEYDTASDSPSNSEEEDYDEKGKHCVCKQINELANFINRLLQIFPVKVLVPEKRLRPTIQLVDLMTT
jgi:hypothetical protein